MNYDIRYASLLACALSVMACAAEAGGDGSQDPPVVQTTPDAVACGIGSSIALRSHANGHYVTAVLDSRNTPLLARAVQMLGWEEYTIVDAGGGWIALRSNANGLYVSADLNAGGALEAGWATTVQGWERFQFVSNGDGWYGIKSYATGLYASANLDASAVPLQSAWATKLQQWEEFQCVPFTTSSGGGGSQNTPGQINENQVRYDHYAGGGSVDQWIQAAAAAVGVPYNDAWRKGYETLTLRESSYAPNAVNTSDGNAVGPTVADGHPQNCSRGIAQCIPPTFAAFHVAGTSLEIYDPVANIAASMKYVMSNYGVSRDGSNLAARVQQADPNRPPMGY